MSKKYDLNDNELDLIRSWYKMQLKVKSFATQSSAITFVKIFAPYTWNDNDEKVYITEPEELTDTEGYRLFQHFRFDCNHDLEKFKTYLTTDQYNDVITYIVRITT